MRRREFISLLGGATVVWPIAARGQQSAIPVVGFLHAGVADRLPKELAGFRRGLSEAGYNEGRNIAIEFRWAEGHYDRLPDMAADLVRRNVAVIVAAPTPSALAAKAATATIPIVFELSIDPVTSGLVASLNRPGGNITGVANLGAALVAKRIEVMHQVVPDAKLIAVLVNPSNPTLNETEMEDALATQAPLGIQIQFLQARTISDIDEAFAKAVELHAGGLIIGADAFFVSKHVEIAALAARYGVPTIDIERGFATAGGLMSYGGDLVDAYHLTGVHAGRILKGEKPADLPVQQVVKVELVINLRTAKALGLTFPLSLLGRADEVIE
jgi:putative tryptophan/tyrosine transport system substrate-binding protein